MHVFSLLVVLLTGCTGPKDSGDTASGGPGGSGITPDPFRLATFNIDWLSPRVADPEDRRPRNNIDHQLLNSLIEENNLDIVALQEIEGQAGLDVLRFGSSWNSVIGEQGWSQNLAILFRSDLFSVDDVREIQLPGTDWPDRYPLVATVRHVDGLTFTLVVVHHNAYAGNADAAYRYNQSVRLREYLDEELPEEVPTQLARSVVIAGDFNDDFRPLNPAYPSLEPMEDGEVWRFATRQAEAPTHIGSGLPLSLIHI